MGAVLVQTPHWRAEPGTFPGEPSVLWEEQ